MAKKSDAGVSAKEAETEKPVFDIKDFLPQGMDEAELVSIGGLRPIVTHETLQVAPVAGWVVGILDMPWRESLDRDKRAKGEKEPWEAVYVELTHPTKAQSGTETVDVPKGREVIIPINASLKNNRDFQLAARDSKHVYWMFITFDGFIEFSDSRNDMANYRIQMNVSQPKPREGKYMQLSTQFRPAELPPATGPITNTVNGQVVERVVG